MLTALTLGSMTAHAGVMHEDVHLQTYTDFGQNCGRYVVGARENALLRHIRSEEKGISIPYTNGNPAYYIPESQGMINFSGMIDCGAMAAIGPNIVASVEHVEAMDASFAVRVIGKEAAIKYSAIDITDSNQFRLTPGNDGMGNFDYMLARQSKIVTDAIWNPVSTITDVSSLQNTHLYRAGGGKMDTWTEAAGLTNIAERYVYLTGGINEIYGVTHDANTGNFGLHQDSHFRDGVGANDRQPLPNPIENVDSGSPTYIYNSTTGRYEYIASTQSGNYPNYPGEPGYNANYSQARGNLQWVTEKMNAFNVHVDMDERAVVHLNACSTTGDTLTDNLKNKGTTYIGSVTGDNKEEIVSYRGVQSGLQTWKDLSGIKDNALWYGYENTNYLQPDDATLFNTQNLVFSSAKTGNTIILEDTVDLGIGYAEFNEGGFTIQAAAGETNEFNHAGYVINAGAEVHLQLKNNANHMTEWRKTGAGDLWIDGSGDTNALLNVGGSGATILNQSEGYAAYNVLASSGATVQIRGGINQIKRDFTFGAGGGTLDMYGHEMTWNNTNSASAEGFTIHALTEEAVITNTTGTTELTITDAGNEFLGSFTDTKEGALRVIYAGSKDLAMHSIRTKLKNNSGSGFEVQSGKVSLSGTNTVHGMGSLDGTSAERLVRDNDWHYADATMDVSVTGGTFELGSHARLTGDVTVAGGATYIMREGVKHDREFVEGGVVQEDVSKYADFYGHHGNTNLADGANLQIQYNNGVTAHNEYGGNITGTGDVTVALGNDGASLRLSGNSDFSGSKTLSSGTLIAASTHALGDTSTNKWQVERDGLIAADYLKDASDAATFLNTHISGESTGTLVLQGDGAAYGTIDMSNHQGMFIGAMEGSTVYYGTSADTLSAYGNQWLLGGGGGVLIVNAQLQGSSNLILGAENAKGFVQLAHSGNNITGTVTLREGVTLMAGSYLGSATILLNYSNRLSGVAGAGYTISPDARGVYLVDHLADSPLNLSSNPYMAVGATNNTTLTGSITVATGASYRFGGMDKKLTVQTALNGDHGLVIDGQTYSGGEVCLATAAGLSGDVTVMGYDTEYTALKTGDIKLSFGTDDALLNAASVTAKNGGTIDLNGTNQTFSKLNVATGGTLTDSAEDKGSLTVTGSADVAGHINVDRLSIGHVASLTGSINTTTLSVGSGTFNADRVTTTNLTKSGSGYLTIHSMENAVNYTGETRINGGTLELNGKGNFTGGVHIAENGKLFINGANLSTDGYTDYSIQNLTGAGELRWDSGQAVYRESRLVLSGEGIFSGIININRADEEAPNSQPVRSVLELASAHAAGSATIQLTGFKGTEDKYEEWQAPYYTSYAAMAVNADMATIGGLTSGNDRAVVFSGRGDAINVKSTASHTLRITGAGEYVYQGVVIGDAAHALSLVMEGSGTQTFKDGSFPIADQEYIIHYPKSAFKNIIAKSGALNIENADIYGNIGVAQGATLTIGNGYSLDTGKTFTVSASDSSEGQAVFDSTLTYNGGTLVFDGGALHTDKASLVLGGIERGSAFSGAVQFINTSHLGCGTYHLANQDWSGFTATADAGSPEYLDTVFSTGQDGLKVTFSVKSDYSLWNGDGASAEWDDSNFIHGSGGGNKKIVFNDAAEAREITIASGTVYADGGIDFAADGDYIINGSGKINAASLNLRGTGRMEVNTDMTIDGALSMGNGGILAGSGKISAESMELSAGSTATFDGVDLTVRNGADFNSARLLRNDSSTTTIHLNNGATFDDRGSYYRTMGALNIEGNGGTMYINGIRMVDSGTTDSSLHIGAGNHLVITGNMAMTDTDADTAGSFSLSHWNAKSSVSIDGTLTSNDVISSWDSRDASVNVNSGGELNLLAGLSRNSGRTHAINVNVASEAAVYAAGGAHQDSLKVNLAAGATLGGIADAAGGTATFSNNMNIGTDGSSDAVVFDTKVKSADTTTFLLNEGAAGNVVLSGNTTIKGTPTMKVTGGGKLWLADGATAGAKGISISSKDGSRDAEIAGIKTLSRDGATVSLAGTDEANRAMLNNTLLDVMADCTLNLSHVVLAANSRITDAAATLNVNDVVVNTHVSIGKADTMAAGTGLTLMGGTEQIRTAECQVLTLSSSAMDTVSVTGESLTLNLSGLTQVDMDNHEYLSLVFTNEDKSAALFSTELSITAVWNDMTTQAYYMNTTVYNNQVNTVYFSTAAFAVPEPATATLSLLALTALAARRRRK